MKNLKIVLRGKNTLLQLCNKKYRQEVRHQWQWSFQEFLMKLAFKMFPVELKFKPSCEISLRNWLSGLYPWGSESTVKKTRRIDNSFISSLLCTLPSLLELSIFKLHQSLKDFGLAWSCCFNCINDIKPVSKWIIQIGVLEWALDLYNK